MNSICRESCAARGAAGLLLLAATALGANPWPGEPNAEAVNLTRLDPEFNAVNMSGATWDPTNRLLWLANNSGRFYALAQDGAGGFKVATDAAGAKARWAPGGDLESICLAEYGQPIVYLLDEDGWIREFDVSRYGVVQENGKWDIRGPCPETGRSGPEALAFVPDAWLRKEGFRTPQGAPYVSTNGMGGVMFVGHQTGGYIHVFDLNRKTRTYGYLGRYKTGRQETAGLEFDRWTGRLYIWHNTGENYLEITDLASSAQGGEPRLRQIAEYVGPRRGNLEGFALILAPTDGRIEGCVITDDDNKDGEAVLWYRRFRLPSR